MELEQLAERCAKVGLRPKKLADLADLDLSTVERTLNRKSRHSTYPRYDTQQKLQTALIGFEKDLLAHLASLHPDDVVKHANVALCPERAPRRDAA